MDVRYRDYVCWNPFSYAEIHGDGKMYFCCPSWLPVGLEGDFNKAWYSEKAQEIRQSILDGSYRFCSEQNCPKLTAIREGRAVDIEKRAEATFDWYIKEGKPFPVRSVKLCFDRGCNLHCQTCRAEKYEPKGQELQRIRNLYKNIDDNLGPELEIISLQGSGEVFFSKSSREWLHNFNPQKYPKLKRVHIHSNGMLWTPLMWDRISNITPYIKSAEISIDAATKETYEKIRRGGKWEVLQNNLQFISTLGLEDITLSFVVQTDNYQEVELFYEMCNQIFNNKIRWWRVSYTRVLDWGVPGYDRMNIFKSSDKEQEIRERINRLAEKDPFHVQSNI